MKGWKTWAGIVIICLSQIMPLFGYEELVEPIITIGAAFGIVGLGHKIEKSK